MDVVDITDFNVVAWLKKEMVGKPNEVHERSSWATAAPNRNPTRSTKRPLADHQENELYAIH